MNQLETVAKKHIKSGRNNNPNWFMLFVSILAAIAVIGLIFFSNPVQDGNESGKDEAGVDKKISVNIPLGSSTGDVAQILKREGVIEYPLLFKIISKVYSFDGLYKSGTHIVSRDLDYKELMSILTSNSEGIKAVIPEGQTLTQIENTLAGLKLIDKSTFEEVESTEKFDYEFLKEIPQRQNRLEGYLFPDTYRFDPEAGEKEIIRIMLSNFNKKFKPEYYTRAKELKMTVDQIITLASIVEREAKAPEERKIIAGVFYNRLNNKDKSLRKLQSCATIQYIFLNKEGKVKEKITEKDTRINNPYNTYWVEGLPPGPICSPGIASIEAALYPQETEYLYFAAKGDGTHQFSKTLKEHYDAMRKYGLN